jgi:hypothetical protein
MKSVRRHLSFYLFLICSTPTPENTYKMQEEVSAITANTDYTVYIWLVGILAICVILVSAVFYYARQRFAILEHSHKEQVFILHEFIQSTSRHVEGMKHMLFDMQHQQQRQPQPPSQPSSGSNATSLSTNKLIHISSESENTSSSDEDDDDENSCDDSTRSSASSCANDVSVKYKTLTRQYLGDGVCKLPISRNAEDNEPEIRVIELTPESCIPGDDGVTKRKYQNDSCSSAADSDSEYDDEDSDGDEDMSDVIVNDDVLLDHAPIVISDDLVEASIVPDNEQDAPLDIDIHAGSNINVASLMSEIVITPFELMQKSAAARQNTTSSSSNYNSMKVEELRQILKEKLRTLTPEERKGIDVGGDISKIKKSQIIKLLDELIPQ